MDKTNEPKSTNLSTNQPDNSSTPNIPQTEILPNIDTNTDSNDNSTSLGSFTNESELRRSMRLNADASIVQKTDHQYDRYYDALHQEDYRLQD